MSGLIHISQGISDRLLQRVAKGTPGPPSPAELSRFDRELQVLRPIGQGLSTRKVAARLHLSVNIIDSH
jgi:DNA-binding NarL/FixJ family response regulator